MFEATIRNHAFHFLVCSITVLATVGNSFGQPPGNGAVFDLAPLPDTGLIGEIEIDDDKVRHPLNLLSVTTETWKEMSQVVIGFQYPEESTPDDRPQFADLPTADVMTYLINAEAVAKLDKIAKANVENIQRFLLFEQPNKPGTFQVMKSSAVVKNGIPNVADHVGTIRVQREVTNGKQFQTFNVKLLDNEYPGFRFETPELKARTFSLTALRTDDDRVWLLSSEETAPRAAAKKTGTVDLSMKPLVPPEPVVMETTSADIYISAFEARVADMIKLAEAMGRTIDVSDSVLTIHFTDADAESIESAVEEIDVSKLSWQAKGPLKRTEKAIEQTFREQIKPQQSRWKTKFREATVKVEVTQAESGARTCDVVSRLPDGATVQFPLTLKYQDEVMVMFPGDDDRCLVVCIGSDLYPELNDAAARVRDMALPMAEATLSPIPASPPKPAIPRNTKPDSATEVRCAAVIVEMNKEAITEFRSHCPWILFLSHQ